MKGELKRVKGEIIDLGEEADERLNVISGDIIPNKRKRFMPHQLQKLRRVKRRKLTPLRPPPPPQKPTVWPPVLKAIQVVVDRPAAIVGVGESRFRVRIGDPIANCQIAGEGGEKGEISRGEDLGAEGGGGGGGRGFEGGFEE